MAKKPAEADETPKKLSIYTIKLNDAQMETLHGILRSRGWPTAEVAYTRFAFKGPSCNGTPKSWIRTFGTRSRSKSDCTPCPASTPLS